MSAAVADGAGANGDATTTTRDGGAAAAANMTGALALLDSYVPGAKVRFSLLITLIIEAVDACRGRADERCLLCSAGSWTRRKVGSLAR